ncbi:TIGR03936 family radical SAM-associated protein [Nocardioides sp. R-C-SC26]|uniref:TIGR03936 family radical SAM-associated protein n=1 Tax=Nocardioides sp. R-C-SC26 TaxID=2870414 RepID=UPI001E4DE07E|nr:TIGR03936 family radical SAM-associated protein [Nocardioides sp. R-C-SC26]
MAREQPEQQAPPVQRLRIRYAKRGRLRFTSHRDFSRAFERAVFRARIPMAYSSGFNPHPRISYAGAAPTGSASEAEYLEIALAQVVDPADVAAQLEEALPPGLDVVAVVESPGGALADLLQASRWRLDLTAPPEPTGAALARFWATDEVIVERMTKKGLRAFDCRAAVVRAEVVETRADGGAGCAIDLVLRHTVPAVRPDDVLSGISAVSSEWAPGGPPLLTRVAQGPLDEASEQIGDPLARVGE